jgi:hypothetical protein
MGIPANADGSTRLAQDYVTPFVPSTTQSLCQSTLTDPKPVLAERVVSEGTPAMGPEMTRVEIDFFSFSGAMKPLNSCKNCEYLPWFSSLGAFRAPSFVLTETVGEDKLAESIEISDSRLLDSCWFRNDANRS